MNQREAVALRERLLSGESWFNAEGQERTTPRAKAKPPRDPVMVPSVADLMARFDGVEPSAVGSPFASTTAQQARVEREAREAREAATRDNDTAVAVASMMARMKSRAERRQSLPCYELDPMAHPDRGGSDYAATVACQSVKAHRTCEWAQDGKLCPRSRVDAAYEAARLRMAVAGVPLLPVALMLAALPGHRVEGRRVAPVPLQTRPALSVAAAWLAGGGVTVEPYAPFADRRPLLVLAGKTGREGKSAAGAWLLAQLDGIWIGAGALAGLSAAEYDRSRFVDTPTLVIDDAGTEPLTEWSRPRMYDVIAERIANNRRTVVTTNIADRGAFVRRYDERLESRIEELGRFIKLAAWVNQ